MKKFTKVLALVVVASMLCLILASCGGLSGKYKGKAYTLEFKGNKVTITGNLTEVSAKGTYKIDDDKITIEFADNDEEKDSLSDFFSLFNGEHYFEKGDDFIRIDILKFEKVD